MSFLGSVFHVVEAIFSPVSTIKAVGQLVSGHPERALGTLIGLPLPHTPRPITTHVAPTAAEATFVTQLSGSSLEGGGGPVDPFTTGSYIDDLWHDQTVSEQTSGAQFAEGLTWQTGTPHFSTSVPAPVSTAGLSPPTQQVTPQGVEDSFLGAISVASSPIWGDLLA